MTDTNEPLFSTESQTSLGVYAGSLAVLEKIDLAFLNVRFLKIESPELKIFIENVTHEKMPGYLNHFDEFRDEWHGKELYILVPINLETELDTDFFIEIQNLFLIMFPSDFRLYAEVHCQLFDNKFLYPNGDSIWNFRSTGKELYDNFMYFGESDVTEINEFVKLYFVRKDSIKYLKITIASYINSFFQSHLSMAFVSLCISLESITDGQTELLYRIRRNSAILNGGTKERAWKISKNVAKFYKLRSTIVHGDEFDQGLVKEYYPKIRSLVSRTIIELITLNINNREELNSILTEAGFGDKHLLVPHYKNFILDVQSLIDIIKTVK